jgi:hypothetical protein
MEGEHLDRQPPRDEAEEREQDRIIEEGSSGAPTELPTDAPDPDLE